MAIELNAFHSCIDEGSSAELARSQLVQEFRGLFGVQVAHVLDQLPLESLRNILERRVSEDFNGKDQVETVQRADIIDDVHVEVEALDKLRSIYVHFGFSGVISRVQQRLAEVQMLDGKQLVKVVGQRAQQQLDYLWSNRRLLGRRKRHKRLVHVMNVDFVDLCANDPVKDFHCVA